MARDQTRYVGVLKRREAPSLSDALDAAIPAIDVRRDVPLAGLSRYRIGGPADFLITPSDRASLAATLRTIARYDIPHVIIGGGSNLLFDDAGFRGIVLKIGRAFGGVQIDRERVDVGAGVWVPSFVRATISAGLAGVVHAIGIPGTLGGLCVMNGGSQRKGIGDHVEYVDVMDYRGETRRLTRDELAFAYRRSLLQDGGLVVLHATLRLASGDVAALRREAIEILASRRAKFPKVRANCGSVFVSDPKLYALIGPPGMAIERAGLKGMRRGDAQISPDHANFIVNNGAARSADVLALIHRARKSVADLTGIAMDAEVRHVAPSGEIRAAHEVHSDFS